MEFVFLSVIHLLSEIVITKITGKKSVKNREEKICYQEEKEENLLSVFYKTFFGGKIKGVITISDNNFKFSELFFSRIII